jgi:hypothetical protein
VADVPLAALFAPPLAQPTNDTASRNAGNRLMVART